MTSRLTAESELLKLLKRIGSTMYDVNVHFSKSSKETLDDKIFRLIQCECAVRPIQTNEYIEKIVVHEADKSSGERRQQVDIYLNFIGDFKIPGNEPKPLTPEEQAAEDKRLADKIRRNEYERKWRAKKSKAKQAVKAVQAAEKMTKQETAS
jgi:hypothetical protein